MPDKYDKQIEILTKNPDRIHSHWDDGNGIFDNDLKTCEKW